MVISWDATQNLHASLLGIHSWNGEGPSALGVWLALGTLLALSSLFVLSRSRSSCTAGWIILVLALGQYLPAASALCEMDSNRLPQSPALARRGQVDGSLVRRRLSRMHQNQFPFLPLLRLKGAGAAEAEAEDAGDDESCPQKRISLGKRTWWSMTTFSYINDLIQAGYRKPLEEDELPSLSDEHSAFQHGKTLEDNWLQLQREADNHTSAAANVNATALEETRKQLKENALFSAIVKVFGLPFVLGGLWKFPHDILSFVSPFLVKMVYTYVDPQQAKGGAVPSWRSGLMICLLFFASQFATSVTLHQYFDRVFLVSMHIRSGLIACMYRKALRLSHSSRQKKSLGELVNLMSVDVQRLTDLVPYLHNLIWSSPLQIVLSMVLLYRLVGVSSLVGLAVMIAVMPINAVILLRLRRLQERNMKEKDRRVKTVSEILQSMKVIKMFAWERPLSRRVAEIRADEVERLKLYGYISSLQSIFWNSAPVTVSIATFGAYAALGNRLDMQVVLPALSVINIMSFPLFVFPLLISAVISGRVAMARLNEFMNLPERDTSAVVETSGQDDFPIRFEGVTVGWNSSRPVLSGVTLALPRGSLTAVVGPVGCGKSTLLSAILGDAPCAAGRVHAPRRLAYVPQQAWIQNADVRDNVLFGAALDEERYRQTLRACALDADLEKLPGGDRTEIGERGVNLSGGQKQRVGIARAVYEDADVYLLDDPLSALDSHVGAHVFQQCVCGVLAGKTRVLVTHKSDLLPSVDRIIVLRDGAVLADGTYAELSARGIALTELCEDPAGAEGAAVAADGAAAPEAAAAATAAAAAAAPEAAEAAAAPKKRSKDKGMAALPPVEGGEPKRSMSQASQMTAEERKQGAVAAQVYLFYLRELRYPLLAGIVALGALSQAARNGNDWWLTRWASAADRDRVRFYLGVYAAWNLVASLLFLARDVSLMLVELRAASNLHNKMLAAVMAAPMNFFDRTPVGRVLNRFSNDQDSLDQTLPRTLNQFFSCVLRVAGTVAVVSAASPAFLVCTAPIVYLYLLAQRYYSRTSRELKRIESTTKSPLYSHFGESIAGASCIRASGAEARFAHDNCAKVDRVNNLFGLMNDCNRWLAIRLELCGNGIVTGAALTSVVSRRLGWLTPQRAALVGLSLTLALAVTNSLGWMVRMSTETEAQMNSVERVAEYASIQSEEDWLRGLAHPDDPYLPVGDVAPHAPAVDSAAAARYAGWPRRGEISIEGFTFSYRPELPPVLSDVTIKIEAGQKVGICGRTGAGKSSLLMALYRMGHARAGRIVVDGVDIAEVPLATLRGGLAIVPQEPMLFHGSVSYNLDPFGEYSEEQQWEALRSVRLDAPLRALPDGLRSPVGEGGSALSVGQRQLLCMARALLRGTRVLVLDEATAAVDEETDAMIQAAVRSACAGCTVVTIAHRLNTIMDYDKVLVLGAGRVLEYAPPQELLARPDSQFAELVRLARVRRAPSRVAIGDLGRTPPPATPPPEQQQQPSPAAAAQAKEEEAAAAAAS